MSVEKHRLRHRDLAGASPQPFSLSFNLALYQAKDSLSLDSPNYIIPSPDHFGTNKVVGACWRNLCGVICANIFAVPRPPWLSPKGVQCGRNFQITWSGKIN